MVHTSKKLTLALGTFVKLVRCTNSITTDVHDHLSNTLTISQFGILEALYHLGPMSQKDLATKILKSAGNITTVINNLERSGLVSRNTNATDKRLYSVKLTDKGNALIASLFPRHAEIIAERFANLDEKEQITLGTLLKKLGTQTVK